MAREAPRTLYSLSAAYQQHIAADDYEIIVVDNGSDIPVDVVGLSGHFRVIRLDPAPKSPARAINAGLAEARGDIVGVMIDGARIATPGLIHFARHGAMLYENTIVATLGWYLGYGFQGWNGAHGYDAAREDALLASIAWPTEGYRLFEIGSMDESSVDGWFQAIAESNALFARRCVWDLLGGVDERFDEPGGGMLNLYTFGRMLDLANGNLVILLGEGTFHQFHGGVSTNANPAKQIENLTKWARTFEQINGSSFVWRQPKSRTYIGTLPPAALSRLVRSTLDPAGGALSLQPLGEDLDISTWSRPVHRTTSSPQIDRIVARGLDYARAGDLEAAFVLADFLRERGAERNGIEYVLAIASGWTLTAHERLASLARTHVLRGGAFEDLGDFDAAVAAYRTALERTADVPTAHLALARLRMPGLDYLAWIERIYNVSEPVAIVEIGVFTGNSLALAKPPTIAIAVDPNARVLSPLKTQTHIFAETSDEFFERERIGGILGDRPVTIGFIDGLHTFEQALRDFIGLEARCDASSTVLFHDTVPLDEITQDREQTTTFYTGDVWRVVLALKRYRPDLDIFTIAAAPTGLTVVKNLDPSSRVLSELYQSIVNELGSVPYSDIEADLYSHLNVIANEEDPVTRRLLDEPAQRSHAALPILGPLTIDREQPFLTSSQTELVAAFHDFYYQRWNAGNGGDTITLSWFGYETLKCPMDMWMYQELIVRTRPDVIVETGTWCGGSALYLAMLLDQLGSGQVITIDAFPKGNFPAHPRIEYVTGSSTDPAIVERVYARCAGKNVMVILDSDHSEAHVRGEIDAFKDLVRPGNYLVVEDTNVNGHPTLPEFGPGPMEAVHSFLAESDEFEIDRRCERFLMTLNPSGYLKRRG